jgi:streptomycin 6-kinase
MIDLPSEFIQTIKNTFREDGKRWLESFPTLLDEASHRWGLIDVRPVPNLSYNFVAMAQSGASDSKRTPALAGGARGRRARPSTTGFDKLNPPLRTEIILKLGVPNRELAGEIAALKIYDGHGTCRLLDADPEKGMLLLERLQPGHMLATMEDDERATRIAAEVMKSLWRSSSDFAEHPVRVSRYKTTTLAPRPGREPIGARRPAGGAGEFVPTNFIYLKDWFDGFKCLRQRFNGGTGPLPEKMVEIAEALSSDLLSENKDETLLHGDFHHYNVLESERGWLAIDPKGVVGPKGYEVGPLLINPIDRFLNKSNPRVQTEKRIAILSEMLGMERERIRSWGICHAILSAWWSFEDIDPGWGNYSVRCAEIFAMVQNK